MESLFLNSSTKWGKNKIISCQLGDAKIAGTATVGGGL